MTDTKFTPGPWRVYSATNGKIIGIGVDRPGEEDHGAGVTDPGFGLWGDESEKAANARLIAAAPDLFAALESAEQSIAAFIGVHGYPMDSGAGEILREVSAALAKARGQA